MLRLVCALVLLCLAIPAAAQPAFDRSERVTSPDGRIVVEAGTSQGRAVYRVNFGERTVLSTSRLGFIVAGAPGFDGGFVLADTGRRAVDTTWTQPWGEEREIREHFNELTLRFQAAEGPARSLIVTFRVFDDGLGFRYTIPKQPGLPADIRIVDEATEFSFAENLKAWWIPAYQDNRYEYLYAASSLDSLQVVHTPLTLEGPGLAVSLHEAALVDFASMALRRQGVHNRSLKADLVPWADGTKVYGTLPVTSPWRTVQIAAEPHALLNSRLILNLNEPNVLGDVSWVKPAKYMGIWWCMHIRTCTWEPGPNQGATTAEAKRHIDFAAAQNVGARHPIAGLLVEGWNVGWHTDWFADGSGFDFTAPVAGFDLEAVAAYATAKGVPLIGHHETGADIANYERQMEDAFALYDRLGVRTVKTGYVGTRLNKTEWHHGQFMVRHFQKALETAARHRIAINAHEPIKDTGLRRTWPNMLSREGARGQEYDAWGPTLAGNLPDHHTILPFTRMLAGPMDFTPGIFDLRYGPDGGNGTPTTLAKQLALYVVLYSPVQMVADLPENYVDQPAFQFIRDVAVDWEESVALNGEIGRYVTIARKERDGTDWFLGAVTNEEARTVAVPLGFLDRGRTYRAEIYADGPGAHWLDNPQPIAIATRTVTAADTLDIVMAPGGGQAIRFTPLP